MLTSARNEVLPADISTNDLDEISRLGQELLDAAHTHLLPDLHENEQVPGGGLDFRELRLINAPILTQFQSFVDEDAAVLLLPIYEDLLAKWIGSLAKDASPRSRVWQDKLVRQASVQLFLACSGLGPTLEDTMHGIDTVSQTATGTKMTLPLREKVNSNDAELPTRPLQSQGDSSPSRRKGSGPASSSQPSYSDEHVSETKTIRPGHTLAQYCSVADERVWPNSLRKISDEWDIGGNPSQFRWSTTKDSQPTQYQSKRKKKRRTQYPANSRTLGTSQTFPIVTADSSSLPPPASLPYEVQDLPLVTDADSQDPLQIPAVHLSSQVMTQSQKPKRLRVSIEGFR